MVRGGLVRRIKVRGTRWTYGWCRCRWRGLFRDGWFIADYRADYRAEYLPAVAVMAQLASEDCYLKRQQP